MGNQKTIYYLKEIIMKETQDFLGFDAKEVHKYEKEYFDFQQSKEGFDMTFYGNWQRDFAKLLIELANLKSNPGKEWHVILDVGCATGINLRGIDELGIFSRLIGTDISNYIINEIIPTLYNFESYAKFYATPSHDLSMIEKDDVDLITCTHVLEHVISKENLIKTLEEFKRVLHSNGKIIIIIPTTEKELNEEEHNHLHKQMHTNKWWSKTFAKYFKSESLKARLLFKKSKLKPDRNSEKTFHEEYEAWSIFRLVHK